LTDAMCKWPTGDPATEDFHFCGHKVREGAPYCEYHSRVAYQPVGDRRRERRAV
jgi:GcrA cell cycle regulator